MYKRNAQGWSKHLDFIILDEIILMISFLLAMIIRHGSITLEKEIYRTLMFVLILADILTILFFNVMHDVLKRGYGKEFSATFRLALVVFLISTGFMFSTQSSNVYSRLILYYTAILHLVLGYASRVGYKKILKRYGGITLLGAEKRSMLAILKAENAEEMTGRLLANPAEPYRIVGLVLDKPTEAETVHGIPIVATLDTVSDCRQWIDSVYIDCPSTDPKIQQIMQDCREMAVPIHYHIPGVSKRKQKQFVERIAGSTVLTLSNTYATPLQVAGKRIIDFVGGVFDSLAALLIMAVIGPIIKHASPGPILYKSERIGKNGKHFISCMSQLMRKRHIFA